jgi:flagellar hook-associated protein 1 FlgK
MSGGDIIGIGLSGLLAYQRSLAATSHNISNVNTEGYSRQRVELGTQPPQFTGAGYLGQGVRIESVRRVYDDFLTSQVRTATSSFQQLDRYYQLASQVDNLFADPQASLSTAMQGFFNAVQGVANDPASIPARQVMVSEGGSLAERFHYFDRRLADLDAGVNGQIRNAVADINSLATELARLNEQIVLQPGQGIDPPANDLLDRRDQVIAKLSEYVSVTTVPQDDGALNVFIGKGQALVVGFTAQQLSLVTSDFEATRYEVGYTVGGNTVNITGQIGGGTLGAALAFRSEILDPARNSLGQIAIGLSSTFNAQHALGVDLDGNLGGNFFAAIAGSSPTVSGANTNTGSGVVAASVTNVAALTDSDYLLERNGASYTLTRLSDGAITTLTTFPGAAETVDGVTISLSMGAIASGDRFLIRPTRAGANDFSVMLGDVRRIAAAGALAASSGAANTGNGRLTTVAASSATGLPLSAGNGAVTLTYDATNQRFAVADGSGPLGFVNYNPATDSGATLTLPAPLGFITFQATGTPANGDAFTIGDNTNGDTDNRNALALAALMRSQVMAGGTATYGDIYGELIADVGSRTHAADLGRQAQQIAHEQAVAAREAISGVNLDEEAANLVRFQQAYQAAAQVISTANTMFDTLMLLMRR